MQNMLNDFCHIDTKEYSNASYMHEFEPADIFKASAHYVKNDLKETRK
jgi:hypothetical protein